MNNIRYALQHIILHLLMVLFALLIYSTAVCAQTIPKIYASSQTSQINGLCLLCSVNDPNNAVGSNQDDYSSLVITVGLLGVSVEQTLIFPSEATGNLDYLTVGVGTGGSLLSLAVLGTVTIETYLGNTPNNDATVIDSSILHLLGNTRATAILNPEKNFDRVKITRKSSLLGLLADFRLYYAFYSTSKISACGTPPPNPIAYFPFNGNAKDTINDYNSSTPPTSFTNDAVCGQAIAFNNGTPPGIQISGIPLPRKAFTYAFWTIPTDRSNGAIILEIPGLSPSTPIFRYYISRDIGTGVRSVGVNLITNMDQFLEYTFFLPEDEYRLHVVTYDGTSLKSYVNAHLGRSIPANGTMKESTVLDIGIYGSGKLDELFIYDRALTGDEVTSFYNSYHRSRLLPTSKLQTTTIADNFKTQQLNFYPNPTNGLIQISNKIDLNGSTITVSSMQGRSIYSTALQSNNIQLPSSIPAGTYLIHLQAKDRKIYYGKITVIK